MHKIPSRRSQRAAFYLSFNIESYDLPFFIHKKWSVFTVMASARKGKPFGHNCSVLAGIESAIWLWNMVVMKHGNPVILCGGT